MNIPEGLKYTKEHEWVKEENGMCLVGITDYAQGELGDIIYLDVTAELGAEVKQGDAVGSIEAIKTVSEVFSPVSGRSLRSIQQLTTILQLSIPTRTAEDGC